MEQKAHSMRLSRSVTGSVQLAVPLAAERRFARMWRRIITVMERGTRAKLSPEPVSSGIFLLEQWF